MLHVSIIGSGNVGANAAFFIAERGVGNVSLFDIQDGIALGKSLDIMEAAPVRKYRTYVSGAQSLDAIKGSDLVVVAAGENKRADQADREQLSTNRRIVKTIARQISSLAPESIVIVASEPVDIMTALFYRETAGERHRIMGVGGYVGSARFRFTIARELGISPEDVAALVIGPHSREMLCLARYSSVSGIPLTQLFDDRTIARMVEETKNAELDIVGLAKRFGSFYTPAAAIAELIDAIHRDLKKIVSVSINLDGEYGLKEGALSLPVVVGRNGIERILTLQLTENELELLRRCSHNVVNLLEGDRK